MQLRKNKSQNTAKVSHDIGMLSGLGQNVEVVSWFIAQPQI